MVFHAGFVFDNPINNIDVRTIVLVFVVEETQTHENTILRRCKMQTI